MFPAAREDKPQCLGTFQLLPGVSHGQAQIQRVESDSLPPPNESFSSHIKGGCIQGLEEFIHILKNLPHEKNLPYVLLGVLGQVTSFP